MQVFNEPEQNVLNRRDSDDYIPVSFTISCISMMRSYCNLFFQEDNTYATIQHPNRRGSSHMAAMSLSDDLADYATLSGVAHRTPGSNNSSLREAPNVSTKYYSLHRSTK